ncbi:putative sulfate exporter family transporter [Bradyrhizobium lablabi]|uniref:YeiH family protein n=1 Tax=Bradyrhizobium lablabi TaxID=722472 RepID=UPI001BA48AB2|nr:putative sulfate exporter family transporter [Bradyrhizobium lablabi]MBR1124843.1 putative sulfate exporter family transporter [Bradyrhizobium lablabi]
MKKAPQDRQARVGDRQTRRAGRVSALIPGILLCVGVAGLSAALEAAERFLFAHPYVEALVLAILLGMTVRSFWKPPERWQAGIAFSAKQLLEVAVMLLGASVSFAVIAASGAALLATIAVVVVAALGFSFGISRMLGLSTRLSILIACGNSICGNSAIATVAPIIGADHDEIASSISFTAILGVIMVLGLPLLIPLLQLSATQYGILAGLTVYAVPQVLAATVPAGLVSTQIGTLVKLVRVLMLGPVAIGLSLFAARRHGGAEGQASISFFRLVPWFISGFLALAALRSFNVVPAMVIGPLTSITSFLTVISMAALGLGVDVRVLANVGGRVTAAVTLSLLLLLTISSGLAFFFFK